MEKQLNMNNTKSKKFLREFIGLYKSFPCMWNIKSKEFKNKHLRKIAMSTLIEKCKEANQNANHEFVMARINNLKTTFKRELKKVRESKRTATSSDDIYISNLWYYDLLMFTEQDVKPEESDCGDEYFDPDNIFQYPNNNFDTGKRKTNSSSFTTTPTATPTPTTTPIPTTTTTTTTNILHNKKKFFDAACKYMESNQSDDEYDIAGKRIGLHLKSMSEDQRLIAEKLFADISYLGRRGKLTEDTQVLTYTQPTELRAYYTTDTTTEHDPINIPLITDTFEKN